MSLDYVSDKYSVRKVDTRFSVVPWYNVDEFIKVYEYAYSNEIVKKRWAYDTMSVWDTRCYPSLPAAIECTYTLLGAVIQDILWNSQKSIVNHGDVQCIYGSAITRFVSLMVETHKDLSNQSTAEIVKRLGIPPFIAHIRNEWCHSSRPSLAMLRLAAEDSLRYLKEIYWEKQVYKIKNHVKMPQDSEQIRKWLCFYIHCRFLAVYEKAKSAEGKRKKAERVEDMKQVADIILKLKELIRKDKRKFIKVLVSNGIFIPFDDDLREMMDFQESKLWESDSDENDDEKDDDGNDNSATGLLYVESKGLCLSCVPKIHEELWAPIIATLNLHDAIPLFMESLLRSQHDRSEDGQKLLIAWVLKILRIHASGARLEKSTLRGIFRRRAIIANWQSMFYSAIIKPCKYTLYILPLILCHLDLDHDTSVRVTSLLAIYLGHFRSKNLCTFQKVFTFDEFKITDVHQKEEIMKQRKKETSDGIIWSHCLDNEFLKWPAGYVMNVEKEDEDELESDEDIEECMEEEESEKILGNENGITKECEMDVDSRLKLPGLPEFNEIKNVMRNRGSLLYKK